MRVERTEIEEAEGKMRMERTQIEGNRGIHS